MDTKKIPFPQANDMNRIYKILEYSSWNEIVSKTDLMENEGFYINNERQCDYYLNALAFLGLLNKEKGCYTISVEGRKIFEKPIYERFELFCEVLLCNDIIRMTFYLLKSGYDLAQYTEEIAEKISKQYNIPGNTSLRRASTVISWVKWITDGIESNRSYEQKNYINYESWGI